MSVHLDADALLARIRQDFPMEYELSRLRALSEVQAAEIERLRAAAEQGTTHSAPNQRPYLFSSNDPEATQHG